MAAPSSLLLSPSYRAQQLKWLQGDNSELTQEVLVMFLMQPNCPGCILHGLPVVNSVASSKNLFDIYCVATAFEDFEFNTIEGTQELLQGRLHGDSAKKLGQDTEIIPLIPVAFDHVVDRDLASDTLRTTALNNMKENAHDQLQAMGVPQPKIEMALKRMDETVGVEALPEKIAEVFWNVRAQGTPTWVVHRTTGEVLGVQFGFMDEEKLTSWVNELVGEAV